MTTTTTVTASNPPPTNPAKSRFTDTLASEWTKFWTLRFTRSMLIAAVALAAGMAAVFCLTTGVTENKTLAELSPIGVAETSLLGADFAVIVLIVLCASATASEHATGMIRLSLAATPRRWRLLSAKGIVLTATALGAGALATMAAVGTGQLILSAHDLPLISFSDPQLLRLILGAMLMPPFYSLLAVALAFTFRGAGEAITAVLAIMLVPAIVGWLPPMWKGMLLPLLPVSALHSLSGVAAPDALEYLAPGSAAAVLIAWAAALFVVAYISMARRDA